MTSLPSGEAGPWQRLARHVSSKAQVQGNPPGSPPRDATPSSPATVPRSPGGLEGPGGTARQDSTKSSKSLKSLKSLTAVGAFWLSEAQQSRLQRRVDEMELWKPETDFLKDSEYWRRRDCKRRQMQAVESNTNLVRWRKLYIPAFLALSTGFALTLTCSIRGLGEGTFLWPHRFAFQVTGFTLLAGGLLLLLLAAGATYHVEDRLRKQLGLPPMFILPSHQGPPPAAKVKDGGQQTSGDDSVTVARNRARGLRSVADSGETSAFLDTGQSGPGQSCLWPSQPRGARPAPLASASTEEGRPPLRTLRADLAGQRSMSVESENSSGYSTGLSDSGRGGDGTRFPPLAASVFSRNGFHRLCQTEASPGRQGSGEFGLSTLAACAPCRLRDCCLGPSLWAAPHPGSAVRCSPYNLRLGCRDSAHLLPQEASHPRADVVQVDHGASVTSSYESDVRGNDASVTSTELPTIHGRIGIYVTPADISDITSDVGTVAQSAWEGRAGCGQEGEQWGRVEGKTERMTSHSSYRVGMADVVIHATGEDYV